MFIEHVNLTVRDLDRSLRYYTELLALELRWEGQALAVKGLVRAAHLGTERCYLALFEAESPESPAETYGRAGLNHVGFVIEDLVGTRERAIALGTPPHFEPEYDPGRRFYVFDPDGIEVELVSYD